MTRRQLIEQLHFSQRTYNILVRHNLVYVDELYTLRVIDLARWSKVGPAVLAEIVHKIHSRR